MPDWLTVDRAIGIASIVLAFLLGRYFFRKQIRDRTLVYDQHGPFQSAGIINATDAPIKIDYDGVPVEQVWRTLVLLWNQGYRAIDGDYFIAPVTASCGPEGQFLSCGVLERDLATNASVSFDRTDQSAILAVTMLRPGEAVVLYFDTDTKAGRPNLSFQTRNSENVGKPSLWSRIIDPLLISAIVMVGTFVALILAGAWTEGGSQSEYAGNWTIMKDAVVPGLALAAILLAIVFLGAFVFKAVEYGLRKSQSPVVFEFYRRKRARNQFIVLRRDKMKMT